MGITWNDLNQNSFGGTELMGRALENQLSADLLDKFEIIPSRLRKPLDETKHRILWLHDLPMDPECDHLKNNGWNKFHRLVFVSNWQQQQFISHFNIPWSKCVVLQNAIEPITPHEKPMDQIGFVYSGTPHRGLNILVPVFNKLAEKWGDKIHLHVYSSFEIYGWGDRDKEFEPLISRIKEHPHMTYHGFVPNEQLKEDLKKYHVFAYPCNWPETSCIALIEAMSAGLVCVHPNFAALPETAANWTYMYPYHEVLNSHATRFYGLLEAMTNFVLGPQYKEELRLKGQMTYINSFYSWDIRKAQWQNFLEGIAQEPLKLDTSEVFSYRTC